MQVSIVKSLRGGGKSTKAPLSTDDKRKKLNHSLVLIESSGEYCFLRALALRIYHKESYATCQRMKWMAIKKSEQKQLELVQLFIEKIWYREERDSGSRCHFAMQKMIHDYRLII